MTVDFNTRADQYEIEAAKIYAAHYGSVTIYKMTQRKLNYVKPVVFNAKSKLDLYRKLKVYKVSLGPVCRGNSRHGAIRIFYADLVQYFSEMQTQGFALPQSHLSRKQITSELYDILDRHGYIPSDTILAKLLVNSHKRNCIFHKVERIFSRVIKAVKKYPRKNTK